MRDAASLDGPRTCLYVPGSDEAKLRKALTAGADLVIADLEDAVIPDAKSGARATVARWLADARDTAGPPRWVRVNGDDLEGDLAAVVRPGLGGVVVPKCEGATQLAQVDALLHGLEEQASLPGGLPVAAIIESARGLLAAPDIARSPRVVRLHLGETDLLADLGVSGLDEAALVSLRLRVVVASAAAELEPPIGPVHTDLGDEEGLRRSTEVLQRLGFGGRSIVHPRQVSPVHDALVPSADDVDAATALLARFDAERRDRVGVYVGEDGTMVDAAVVRAAERVLERAQRRR